MATTPAAIAAEATAAQRTEYEPAVHLGRIHTHPRNPRHHAIADDELLDSIREQGLIHDLVVAPHPDREGEYILIDGHRRFDGCTRAGFTYVPVKIRHDLVDEAAQIAAMLATIRRENLTPIEEAEGFDLLTELGWSTEQIAAATGRSTSTVKSRRKLTSLKPTFQEQVTSGQVTLDDALILAALPEKEQKRLEKVGPTQIRYELARSQDRVRAQDLVDKQIKELTALGGAEQAFPRGGFFHGLTDEKDGMTPFPNLPPFLREPERHHGCLGWCDTGTAQYPGISLVCTNVSGHDDEVAAYQAERVAALSAEEKARAAEAAARAAEQESRREERAAAQESRRVAARLRGDVVLEATRKVKTPALLAPVLRSALTDFFTDWPLDEQLFQDLADVPENLRWNDWQGKDGYLDTIASMTPTQLWRAFTAALIAHIEQTADYSIDGDAGLRDAVVLGEYLSALTAAGHQPTPPDEELQRSIDAATTEDRAS